MGCTWSRSEQLPELCYLDVAIDNRSVGRLVVRLRPDVVPRTCRNFVRLCEGKGRHPGHGYAGTKFHRIEPRFCVQGGDCGPSIYGEFFKDESFALQHMGRGTLYMANCDRPNSNGSQFWICLADHCSLHDKFVVFGRLESGFDALQMMEEVGTNQGHTSKDVMIMACGVIHDSLQSTSNKGMLSERI
mmetsp:Transcript_41098/g.78478  ORF Transcript_41098/g.78478 Transcript_41098/m.78478 type:complete len:188 (-) Transcript_41098:35-598(-)|eukprot:CAMPEP_0114263056 /NCGR_PEP_ID=MMETSP0058-20121206/22233_1 /TAXON_ID=36894 /ORGANISM="Pyramimonas parkeae, CCMP726" /LENGTH=187 /DNA_ID=CAMNT_0001379165 /DNA_START=158 /DNA_END=721 /DNA_ORIENTATION=+